MKIRTVGLMLLIGSVGSLACAPVAPAATGQVATVVWSPHPDDETLRLLAYTQAIANRGDYILLEAVTDGEASGVKEQLGLTTEQLATKRRAEQTNAFGFSSFTKGTIERLYMPDGAVKEVSVCTKAQEVDSRLKSMGYKVEHYIAASSVDAHPDHKAVASGVNRCVPTGTVVRTSKAPDQTGGWSYSPSNMTAAVNADNAYKEIGWKSTPDLFQKMRDQGYKSRITVYGS